MEKTIQQLQAELDRERDYTRKVNDRYERVLEQLKNSIPKIEHERIVNELRRDYERKLSEVKPRIHNEYGAGRKRVASKAIMTRVMELHGQGLSHAKIASKLTAEGIKIGRTTVGEITLGVYKAADGE